jgi:polysaccharide biosynthesis protein PslL
MRQGHLDMARAISITLVVVGHGPLAAHYPDIHLALSNLRMPLLLMLAGMHLRPTEPLWNMARHKADALLKPYLVMAVLLGVHTWWQGKLTDLGALSTYASNVLSFSGLRMPGWLFPMWFLTLLWTLHVGVSALLRQHPVRLLPRTESWALVGALGVLGYMGLPSSGLDPFRCVGSGLGYTGWFFNLDLWALGAAWFLAGHLLADSWKHEPPSLLHTLMWTGLCAAILLLWQPRLDMLMRESEHTLASVGASISGAWAVLGWSRLIQRWGPARRCLAPVGRYSLYILLMHAPIQSLLNGALARLMPEQAQLSSWLGVAAVLAICVEWGRQTQRHAHLMVLFEPRHRLRQARTAPPSAPPSVEAPAAHGSDMAPRVA